MLILEFELIIGFQNYTELLQREALTIKIQVRKNN